MLPIEDFKETFQVMDLPEEERGHYQTVGGLVMMHLEKIPATRGHFEMGRLPLRGR